MANRVITISRQFGSGGRTVGRMTAMKLGIPCYDQELIQKVAEESGFAERYIQERGEEFSSGGWLTAAFTDSMSTMSVITGQLMAGTEKCDSGSGEERSLCDCRKMRRFYFAG